MKNGVVFILKITLQREQTLGKQQPQIKNWFLKHFLQLNELLLFQV